MVCKYDWVTYEGRKEGSKGGRREVRKGGREEGIGSRQRWGWGGKLASIIGFILQHIVAFEMLQTNDKVTFALEGENMAFGGWLEQKGHLVREQQKWNAHWKGNSSNCFLLNASSRRGKRQGRDSSREQDRGLYGWSALRITLLKRASGQKAVCHAVMLGRGRWWEEPGHEEGDGRSLARRGLHETTWRTLSPRPRVLVLTPPGTCSVTWSEWVHLSGILFYNLRMRTLQWDRFFENMNVLAGIDSSSERPTVEILGELSLRKKKYQIEWESTNL